MILLGSNCGLKVLVSAQEIKVIGGVMMLINLVQFRLEEKK